MRSAATAAGAFIERRALLLLVALLAALTVATLVLAEHKPLWNDELFTYYISRLSVADMWSTLRTGVEQTPLTFYLATRGSVELVGDGGIGMRLPELAGYLLMSVCLFALVARRSTPLYGLVAVLFAVATIAFGYAYEARAYGLVLGFSAAALLCWEVAAEGGPRRRLAAVGIAVTLAAAVASHYYAVLVVLPLLAGEATRTLVRRRVDWLVVGAFAGILVPLVAFEELIRESDAYSTTFWGRPTWHAAVRFYPDSLMDRALLVVVAVVATALAVTLLRTSSRAARKAGLRRPPDHELVALVTLALLPFFGVLLGKLVTGAFTDRYVLSAIVAMSALLALAAWWADGGVPLLGIGLLVVLTVFAGVRISSRYDDATSDAHDQTAALRLVQREGGSGLPIAVASPHDFFELSHRVSRQGGPGLVYLADPKLAQRYLGTDAVDLGVVGMRDIAPLHVVPYARFLSSHRRFEVYGKDRAWDWLSTALLERHARFTVVAGDGGSDRALREVWLTPPSRGE